MQASCLDKLERSVEERKRAISHKWSQTSRRLPTWSGLLVDAGCFRSVEDNHNVSDSPVLKDVGLEVRLCHPKVKTHSFAIVQSDGQAVALDSAGNTQAAQSFCAPG
jgi:hypothetical protein